MDDYNNKINNSSGTNEPEQSNQTAQPQSNEQSSAPSGFYSYKRPDTANSPEYSATTQPSSTSGTDTTNAASGTGSTYSSQQSGTSGAAQQSSYTSQPNASTQSAQSSQSAYGSYQGYTANPTGGAYQSYQTYSAAAPTPKIKKEKRKVSITALIACCLVCAIISGVVASAGVMFGGKYISSLNSSDTGSSNSTVINVDKTASNVVSAVAQKVIPSVVGIRVTSSVTSWFGMSQEQSSEGSGVIYTSDGYIVTNYHVISSAATSSSATLNVYLSNDPETAIHAKVIGYYSESDLAVIKIEKTGLAAAEFADSDKLEVGENAIAIGNPGGLEFMSSVSSGIISGLNRTLKLEGTDQMKLVQTDAAINPGNSGGALCNSQGQLIGINSSKISSTDFEGMGFAIPSNYVKTVCDDIINNKDAKKAYLGVKISTEYDEATLRSMGYPAGAVVEEVASNSPAENAGISKYDIITSFNGVDISNYSDYNKERLKAKPGENVKLTIYRNGRYYDVSVTLGESNN